MSASLLFQNLFAYSNGSLAWVRVYRCGQDDAVALVLDPTDNPGASANNAAEQLLADLDRAFPSLGAFRVFVRFPEDTRGDCWIEILEQVERIDFTRHTANEVEDLLGLPIDLELGDPTCAGLGGEHHPLLTLIPPPEEDVDRFERVAVVAIADLPWAHNPGSCLWKPRFEELEAFYPPSRRHRPALGAHWYLTLSGSDFSACRYHEGDWKQIAAVAVEVFEDAHSDGGGMDDVLDAIGNAFGESIEGSWCASLFTDPIVWQPGHPSITNGQHRTCALKASGAPFCVVDVYDAFLDEPVAADPRRRAAAEVSSFWLRQASQ